MTESPGAWAHLLVRSRAGGVAVAASALLVACDAGPSAPRSPVVPEFHTVTIRRCPRPAWIGYRNADGPWKRLTPDLDGATFRFQATERHAVAIYDTLFDHRLRVWFIGGNDEIPDLLWQRDTVFPATGCSHQTPTVTMNGQVIGQPDSTHLHVVGGWALPPDAYGMQVALDDTFDVVALARRDSSYFLRRTIAARAVRNLGASAATQLPTIDFTGAPAPDSIAVDVQGASFFSLRSAIVTARGDWGELSATWSAEHRPFVQVLPAGVRSPNDLHLIAAATLSPAGARGVELATLSPTSGVTIALGPDLAEPQVIPRATGALPSVAMPRQPEYGQGIEVFLAQQATTSTRFATLTMTAQHSSASTWEMSLLELTLAPGFRAEWGLVPGVAVTWHAVGWSGPVRLAAPYARGRPAPGISRWAARVSLPPAAHVQDAAPLRAPR